MIRSDTATKTQLLALPHLEWKEPRGWWDALLILPTRKKHDSEWAHIALIGVKFRDDNGVKGDFASHTLAFPDDISWPPASSMSAGYQYPGLRTDAYYPSGVLRLWSPVYQLSVSSPVSSVDILIRKKDKE